MTLTSRKAFTFIELMIVLTIIGLLLAIGLPNFFTSSRASSKAICINDLKLIDAAADQWATDNNIQPGTVPSPEQEAEIYTYVRNGKPKCPSSGEYAIHAIGSSPQVTCNRGESEGHKLPE